MGKVTGKLTVFFEEPFWVGVFERWEGGRLSASRVVFGAEPRDQQVWELVLYQYSMLRFSPAVEALPEKESTNPKRLQREARRQVRPGSLGTKSQQALQLQRELGKADRKAARQKRELAEKQRRYEQKQQKRKQKHRGH